jgi:hypothetical protein
MNRVENEISMNKQASQIESEEEDTSQRPKKDNCDICHKNECTFSL